MSIMASFSGFKCPECGQMIMASEVKGLHEPGLALKVCDWCGAELQIIEDPQEECGFRVEKLKVS